MNMVNVINAIIADGSTRFTNRIPVATRDNIEAVGNAILEYAPDTNTFLNILINKIVMSVIHSQIATNPLAVLKKGTQPLGADIEEIFVNMAQGEEFDPIGSTLLSRHLPDVKVIYHRMNRKSKYRVSISKAQLEQAFTAYDKLENLMTGCINSLYSGDNYDEFVIMKNMLAEAVTKNHVINVRVPVIFDQTVSGTAYTAVANAATALVKAIRGVSSNMQFPSGNFNRYGFIAVDDKPVITWTPREDQILLISATVATEVDVDVLAQAFNMEKAALLANMMEIDNFGAAENTYAMIIDKSFVQVYDNRFETTEFFNPDNLTWTYWLHHWQTVSYSIFANAVSFGFQTTENISAFNALAIIPGGSAAVPVFADAAAVIATLPAFVNANDETISIPVASWTDTNTFAHDTPGSYTFTAVLGTLPTGFTNTGTLTATVEVLVTA